MKNNKQHKNANILVYLLVLSVLASGGAFLVNELVLMALSSMILGDGLTATSTTIMYMLVGTAIGGALGVIIKNSYLIEKFLALEIILAISGAFMPLVLYFVFAYSPLNFNIYLYAVIMLIGFFIGFEVPLLLRLIQRYKNQLEKTLSLLYFAEYLGSAIGVYIWVNYLLFSFLLIEIGFLVAITNLTLAFITYSWYRINQKEFTLIQREIEIIRLDEEIKINKIKGISSLSLKDDLINLRNNKKTDKKINIWIIILAYISIISILVVGFNQAENLGFRAEQKLFRDKIILSKQTEYQKIVITENIKKGCKEMYINNSLQFNSCDEVIYHESLIAPILSSVKDPKNALIIGGGDGIVAKNLRKINQKIKITQIDLDKGMIELARNNDILRGLNSAIYDDINYIDIKGIKSLENPKSSTVDVIIIDVSIFLNSLKGIGNWDLIIVDLPDPRTTELSKLYTNYFYSKLSQRLSDKGVMVIQSTSPFYLNGVYNIIGNTLKDSFNYVVPYHVNVPSFGEWGFYMASNKPIKITEFHDNYDYMTEDFMKSLFIFPKDIFKETRVNSLLNPIIVKEYSKEMEKLY